MSDDLQTAGTCGQSPESSGQSASSSQQGVVYSESEDLWITWADRLIPNDKKHAYFIPPFCESWTIETKGKADKPTHPALTPATTAKLPPTNGWESEVRDDPVVHRVMAVLKQLSTRETFVALRQFKFGDYVGEPCYAAASRRPLPEDLRARHKKNWKEGDFDILLIHRHYGLIFCEVKVFRDNVKDRNTSQQDVNDNIRKKLREAVGELDKAEVMLSHLVHDVAPGLRVCKTMALPNLTARQVQQAIEGDPHLTQDLCRCLGATDAADITGLCLCSDQLPSITYWFVKSIDTRVCQWWHKRVAVSDPDPQMTFDLYKRLVARLCGPAREVTVSCVVASRKFSGMKESFRRITLLPGEMTLLNQGLPRVLLEGYSVTRQTMLLHLMVTEWCRRENAVYVVSTSDESHEACSTLYLQLQQITPMQQGSGTGRQLHHLKYNFLKDSDVEKAANYLSQTANNKPLYVIADNAGSSDGATNFTTFCEMLLEQVPDLHLWAANIHDSVSPSGWIRHRSDENFRYSNADLKFSSTHSSFQFIGEDHSEEVPQDCERCGQEMGRVLRRCRDTDVSGAMTTMSPTTGSTTTPDVLLQWGDVVVVVHPDSMNEHLGFVSGLRSEGVPVSVGEDKADAVLVTFDISYIENKKILVIVDCIVDCNLIHFLSDYTSWVVTVTHSKSPEGCGQSTSSSQQGVVYSESEDLWITWADRLIPNDKKHAYFIPPFCESWTIETKGKADKPTHPALTPATTAKLPPTNGWESEVRDDPVVHRVMAVLKQLSTRETFVALRQFKFGDYVGEPCYAAASRRPLPEDLRARHKKNWKEGDFDILLIHRHYGLIFCEVKVFRDNVKDRNTSQQDVNVNIRKKLREAVGELDKAEVMLSHLVHDVAPGLRVCKTMALPNLTARQVQQAIEGDPHLTQDLCRCLEATDAADITGLCLCSDQLPSITYWFVKSIDTRVCQWWHKRVAVSDPDPQMTFDLYKRLVARLCGPAREVTVSCVVASLKFSGMKESFRRITLLPGEMTLLNQDLPRVLLEGYSVTRQTMLLHLMVTEWCRRENVVYVVSTSDESHEACSTLYLQLQQITRTQQGSGTGRQLHHLKYNFREDSDVEKAVNYLSQTANNKPLYVIAYNGGSFDGATNFTTFCEMLLEQVPDLHLWAANIHDSVSPSGWIRHRSDKCFRSSNSDLKFSSTHSSFQFIGEDHSEEVPQDCERCGQEMGRVLRRCRDADVSGAMTTMSPTTGSTATTPDVLLQWGDVVVVVHPDSMNDHLGFVSGLRSEGVPVSVGEDKADTVLVTANISYIENKKILVIVDCIVDCNLIHFLSDYTSWVVTVTHSKSPEGCGQSTSSSQQGIICRPVEKILMSWVENAFPDLETKAHFLPPVFMNRVPMTRVLLEGGEVLVPQEAKGKAGMSVHPVLSAGIITKSQPTTVQDSDIRDDAAMQRVNLCLQKLSENNREVFVALSELKFGQYLGEPCYAAAAAQLPSAKNLPPHHPKRWKDGDFDVLLIHRHYGLVICEVKSVGANVQALNMSQQDIDQSIRKKLGQAVSQLDKAEVMLSHLVHDVAPGLRVCKTMALPNLTARQVQQAIEGDPKLSQDLCRCLEAADPADITGLCLCSDQLPNITYWFVKSVDTKLCQWWHKRVAVSGPDPQMTFDLYKRLVARLCGPAREVSWVDPPHKIWAVYKGFTRIGLLPEEMLLLNQGLPRVILAGDKVTRQSRLLQVTATEWLRRENVVYVVSTSHESHEACSTLYMQLQQVTRTQPGSGTGRHLHLLKYNFREDSDVEKAVNYLSQTANNKPLYVVADNVGSFYWSENFITFCEMLLKQVPDLHLWAANFYLTVSPSGWIRQLLKRICEAIYVDFPMNDGDCQHSDGDCQHSDGDCQHTDGDCQHSDGDCQHSDGDCQHSDGDCQHSDGDCQHSDGDCQHSDGDCQHSDGDCQHSDGDCQHSDGDYQHSDAGLKFLASRSSFKFIGEDHSEKGPGDCEKCGQEVGRLLRTYIDPDVSGTTTTMLTTTGSATTPAVLLQWRDVLVVLESDSISDHSGFVSGLRSEGVPVNVSVNERARTSEDKADTVLVTSDTWHMKYKKMIFFVDWNFIDMFGTCTSWVVTVTHSKSPEGCGQSPSKCNQPPGRCSQSTSSSQQQGIICKPVEKIWMSWVENAFPDLETKAHFLPPVFMNRVPMTRRLLVGGEVLVPQEATGKTGMSVHPVLGGDITTVSQPTAVQDSDIRDAAAMQRVIFCLQKLSENNREVFVALSQLQFGQYLGEPCYAAAASQLPSAKNLPPHHPKSCKDGDFDVLLIHRHHGLVICEVKSVGANVQALNMSQQDIDQSIRKKLREAVGQLDKAEVMLSHLVHDVAPGVRVCKTMALPNLTARQVQQAIEGDPKLSQELCRCLGAADPADITGLCVCCDQLSDLRTPWDVDDHVLGELATWWQRRVAVSGPYRQMTSELYKTLVARFCGPATTVTVSCVISPRLSVKTMAQAVSATGMCFAEITLFPEQVNLLQRGRPRVLLHGPPGTGKTVMLQLMATDWLRNKQLVHVVSTWDKSLPSCTMLYNLLQTTLDEEGAGTPSQLMFLKYEFRDKADVEKAVNDLVQAAHKNPLHVIVDEVDHSFGQDTFKTFCEKLLEQVADLRLWAASCLHGLSLNGWEQEYLTLPLRSPPTVVREVAKAEEIRFSQDVRAYSATGIPSHTDGPRLKFIGQGHSLQRSPNDCEECGRELGRFLWSLRDPASESSNCTIPACGNTAPSSPDPLQWRDMLVLWWSDIAVDEPGLEERNNSNPGLRLQSDRDTKRYDSAFESGFKNRNIWSGLMSECVPVQAMAQENIDDVATAASDVVWVADYDAVRGLERKVVVILDLHGLENNPVRLHAMSRCTSQLVIVTHSPHVRRDGSPPFKKLRR
ncbi:uncharacterized protein LOC112572468 isoform X1 [Pomacea canaliculata]|uniref:uncharacterized protein LOC112572468 isoform X1 n=1 Tax=Pomacea canaliculata TaxID=400727 RepID=UPI000D73CBC9|nr:uncharacterized protein LOC112572468 isoform X1 [Pomacea canaliculata]